MILRLPEERDFFVDSEVDPLTTYNSAKCGNKGFFSKDPNARVDLGKFGQNNYLTAPRSGVGVPSHKNYYVRHPNVFPGPTIGGGGDGITCKEDGEKGKRHTSKARYDIVKQMLANEKKVSIIRYIYFL